MTTFYQVKNPPGNINLKDRVTNEDVPVEQIPNVINDYFATIGTGLASETSAPVFGLQFETPLNPSKFDLVEVTEEQVIAEVQALSINYTNSLE